MIKSITKIGSGYNTAPQDAIALLDRIPADLPYSDWFRVAAALKNSGVKFEEFDKWSQTAPAKYNVDEAERVWAVVGADDKPQITIGTLNRIADQYNGSIIPAPQEMLLPPAIEERPRQIAKFLELMFRQGESYELVMTFFTNANDKKCPDRSKSVIAQRDESELTDENQKILSSYENYTEGALISLNPIKHIPQGKAPTDADVTDYRYALIEADDLSKEEQWQKLRELNLPILAVVWSGGKSLHTIVKIDAGNDRELYKKRVELLHDYLKEKGYPADRATKNPSRLTRLPGITRGEDMQYMVSGSWGHPDWRSFERSELSWRSASCAKKLSEAEHEESDPLVEQYGNPLTLGKNRHVQGLNQPFFAKYVKREQNLIYSGGYHWQYSEASGLWRKVTESQLNNLIAASIRNYGKQCNADLTQITTASICHAIQSFIEPESEDPFNNQRQYIHVANGMLVFAEDGTVELQGFSPDFYSRNCCPVNYDPQAQCPRFIGELLQPALPKDDIELLQLYCGQCLLGDNMTQTFLVLTGTPGGGKGTIVNIIEHIIGGDNCVEMRTRHLGERFETAKFIGKSLLIGSDVQSDFLLTKDAGYIKSLCGHDRLTAEIKGKAEGISLEGRFNIIITANDRLKMNIDGDAGAWARRVIWLPFERPKARNAIADFHKILLQEEGSGILNWMIEGACKVLKNGIGVNQRAKERIEQILLESNSAYGFVKTQLKKDGLCHVTVDELYNAYEDFCAQNDWYPLPHRKACTAIRDNIRDIFHIPQSHDLEYGGRSVRGYRGLRLLARGELPEPLEKAIVPPVTGNLLNDSPSVILTPEANNAVWFGNVSEPKQLELF